MSANISSLIFAPVGSVVRSHNNTAADFGSGVSTRQIFKSPATEASTISRSDPSAVFRIQFTGGGGTAPTITTHPSNQTVLQGQPATFSVVGQRRRAAQLPAAKPINISGATSSSYTLPTAAFADNGAKFRVVVTMDRDATSNEA